MEKFSAFRDPGTGIQPFLTPLHTAGPSALERASMPLASVLGLIRTLLVLVLLAIYIVLVQIACTLLMPIPPLYRMVTGLLTAVIARIVLGVVGLLWISAELVTRKRGRSAIAKEPWKVRAGDIIVSNWASWIDVLYLAFRFNPIFVIPVPVSEPTEYEYEMTAISNKPGRRTGTGSANISSSSRTLSPKIPISGFHEVSLLTALRISGHVPPFSCLKSRSPKSLQEIRKNADRPLIIFPECTTSNGRGMIRFAHVFSNESLPVKAYKVFVMCTRYDPPAPFNTTLTHSIPSGFLNPLPHLFRVCTSFVPPTLSVRQLSPSESPSSPLFIVSDVLGGPPSDDPLTECCASLISQLGKLKRTGMGWEDKTAFLRFYNTKRKLL